MATTEVGHHASRMYTDQDGHLHMNGANIYLDESGTAWSPTEAAMIEGITAGTAAASKAVVLGTDSAVSGVYDKITASQGTDTLTVGESGVTFICSVDAVLTLPAAGAGLTGVRYIIVNGAVSSGTGLSISPNASDNIYGQGLTAVDNKDLINTGATDRLGDLAEIVCDGTNWLITRLVGTWAKQA